VWRRLKTAELVIHDCVVESGLSFRMETSGYPTLDYEVIVLWKHCNSRSCS
jgi:hypothetical protein